MGKPSSSQKPVELAVSTLNGKLLYSLTAKLRGQGLRFMTVKPGQPIPFSVKAVITTPGEADKINHPQKVVCNENDEDSAVRQAIRTLMNLDAVKVLTIGIDPGKNIGMAVLLDGKLIQAKSYIATADALRELGEVIKHYPCKEIIVKVGRSNFEPNKSPFSKSSGGDLADFLKELQSLGGNVRILSVNENFTTRRAKRLKIKRKNLDEASAVAIALG